MLLKEVYQCLGVTLKSWLRPKRWSTPEKMMEKVVLASESLFRPANSVGSTRLLVKIHNRHTLPHPGKHPAVTHDPTFQSATKMTLQLCFLA